MTAEPVQLAIEVTCRICDVRIRPLDWLIIDDLGYRHPSDCGGDL
jgi:hypothetical protein